MNQIVPLPCLKPHSPWKKARLHARAALPSSQVSVLLLLQHLPTCCFVCQEQPAPHVHMASPSQGAGFSSNCVYSSPQALSILSPCSMVTYVYLCGACLPSNNARAS